VTGIDTSASDVTGIDTSASDTDSGGIDTSATATDTDGSSATTDSGGIDTSATASATDTDGSSGTTDASTTDASTTDASTTDASTTDASTTDASTTDASTTDASTTGGGGPTPAPFVANGTFETADGWTLGGDFAVATSSAGSTTPGALQLSGDFFAYGDASTTYDGSVIEDGVSVAFACRISSSGLAFLSPRLDGVGVSSASGLNCEDQWQVYELCTAELSHGASGTFGFDGLLDFAQPGDVAEIDDITLIPAIDCPPWGEIAYGDVDSGLWFTGDGRTGGVMEASGDRALMLKRTGNTFDPASVVTARTNAAVPTGYAGLALRWAMHGDMPAGSGRYYVQLSGAGASSTYDLEGPFSEATDVDVTLCLDPALEGQAGVITLSWQSYGISDAAHEVYLDDFTFVDEPGCIP
jgi:hypothetical protein